MAFTWVDWAIIAIIAISSLISLKRGFVKEALSLVTWIIAGVVAWMFGGALSQHLTDFIEMPSARVIAGCAILFVATLLVGALVNFLIGELVRVTGLSGTDRFLGMVFGGARGALLVATVDGKFAGCCAMRPLDSVDYANACEMKRLYVRDEFRRLGLGRQLAEGILDASRLAGYSCILLDTLDDMESARALYDELGFSEIPPYYFNPIAGAHYLKADL